MVGSFGGRLLVCVVAVPLSFVHAQFVAPEEGPALVSSVLLAAENDVWDTFPASPLRLNGTCDGPLDAGLLQLPPGVRVFFTDYFRIMEYDDNSTRMDRYMTGAGGAVAGTFLGAPWGTDAYVGMGAQELWDELPVARELETITSNRSLDERFALGGNYDVNVIVELWKDAPVGKSDDDWDWTSIGKSDGGVTYDAFATETHLNNPMPNLIPWTTLSGVPQESIVVNENIKILKQDGTYYLVQQSQTNIFASSFDYSTNPSDYLGHQNFKSELALWYLEGDGTYGGLGGPPLIEINDTAITYL